MKTSKISSLLLTTALLVTTGQVSSHATSTYTQTWDNTYTPTYVITATSSDPWNSVSSGRTIGPLNKMDFTPTAGAQTIRLNLSLIRSDNSNAVDVSSMGCAFRSQSGGSSETSMTYGTGTGQITLSQISVNSSVVVCDLTFGATASSIGIELYTGSLGINSSSQQGYLSLSRLGTGSSATPDETPAQAPAYTGPKISSFNLGSVAPGGALVATGKKLDQIQSATIGGKAASLSYSSTGLTIGVPEDLTPGTYDLVMQTSYGKLTQINAVVVKTKPKLSNFTLRGIGSSISADLAAEIKAIGAMYSADYSKIHCVVNSTDEAAAAIAAEACSLLKTGSLSSATTLTSLKSTFKGSGFWLRVYLAG